MRRLVAKTMGLAVLIKGHVMMTVVEGWGCSVETIGWGYPNVTFAPCTEREKTVI